MKIAAHRLAMVEAFEEAMAGRPQQAQAKLKQAKQLTNKFYNHLKNKNMKNLSKSVAAVLVVILLSATVAPAHARTCSNMSKGHGHGKKH